MLFATTRSDPAVRAIEDLGLSLHVESRDGRHELVASDRRTQRRYAACVDDGREDVAARKLLESIMRTMN